MFYIAVDINKSKKRKTILINQLRGYGISLIDDELTTTVNINHFAEANNRNSIIKELQR